MSGDEEPRLVLDYSQPPPPVTPRRVFAGVFGVAAGLLAALSLFLAVLCLCAALGGYGDSVAAPMFLLLIFGVVLIIASREWCRYARGPGP